MPKKESQRKHYFTLCLISVTRMNHNDLLTIQGVADLLGVSRQTIYNWMESGTSPPFLRVGGRTLFQRGEVETWKKRKRWTGGYSGTNKR